MIRWLLLLAIPSYAAVTVDVAWDCSIENVPSVNRCSTNVTGYFVYYGPTFNPVPDSIEVGTNLTATITNLLPGFTYRFYVTAHDDLYVESDPSNVIEYTVPEENHAPVLDPIPVVTASVLQTITITALASDQDTNQTLTFSLIDPPIGAIIDPSSGVFTWTTEGDGVFPITIMVRDNGIPVLADTQTFTVTVVVPSVRITTFLESSTKDPKTGPWTTEKAFETQVYTSVTQKFYRVRMEIER